MHPISRHVIPVPSDWPGHVFATGYWFLDAPDTWTPPDDLSAFLASGEAPVYVGFGSMVGTKPKELTDIIIGALQKANVRGVLASGWGGIEADAVPDSIFMLKQAPHSWLFPRMAALVHHGGAGTTAAGLRAGKPTFISPYFGDQPFWSERIYSLGVGPKPIHQNKLTIDSLGDAIIELVSSSAFQEKAKSLGKLICQEDGVGNAIAIIEKTLQQKQGQETGEEDDVA